MKDLIKALEIFLKYQNKTWPTICEHDVLIINGIERQDVSDDDHIKLEILGFEWNESYGAYVSYRFGSA